MSEWQSDFALLREFVREDCSWLPSRSNESSDELLTHPFELGLMTWV